MFVLYTSYVAPCVAIPCVAIPCVVIPHVVPYSAKFDGGKF